MYRLPPRFLCLIAVSLLALAVLPVTAMQAPAECRIRVGPTLFCIPGGPTMVRSMDRESTTLHLVLPLGEVMQAGARPGGGPVPRVDTVAGVDEIKISLLPIQPVPAPGERLRSLLRSGQLSGPAKTGPAGLARYPDRQRDRPDGSRSGYIDYYAADLPGGETYALKCHDLRFLPGGRTLCVYETNHRGVVLSYLFDVAHLEQWRAVHEGVLGLLERWKAG